MSAFLELLKSRLSNVTSFLTSKRAYAAAGSIVLCKFLDNSVALGCATAIAITYILCDTAEKFVKK